MVAVKAADASRSLARLDPKIAVILLYGPDAGLAAERAKAAVETAVADPSDPFSLVKLDGDMLAGDPARLADEAGTIGIFGGRRAIWVKPTSKNIAPAVEAALDAVTGDSLIVIEAGDLAKSSPLRNICERSPRALAIPCYADEGRDLGQVVEDSFRTPGISVSRETKSALIEGLGANRLATRSEIEKILLYAHGSNELTLEDLEAIMSDVSALRGDMVVDAAFAGDAAGADDAYQRLLGEGTHAAVILGALLRHALAMLPYTADVETGRPPSSVVESWRGLHFKRKQSAEKHLTAFDLTGLRGLIDKLQAAILDTRRVPDLTEVIASRIILEIATRARGRGQGRQ
jgi:DNA polymerase-3 subunit delta